MISQEQEEGILQGLLAAAGFVNSAIGSLLNGNTDRAYHKLANALTILEKLIKSIRG